MGQKRGHDSRGVLGELPPALGVGDEQHVEIKDMCMCVCVYACMYGARGGRFVV